MIGKVFDGRYELVEFIGKGGMALVYRALDQRTGHNVAVKILRPEFAQDEEFLERFDREAQTASKMSHHNIVNLLDIGQEGDLRYLVMEYVNGRTLKEVIQQKGALPPTVAAQICIRILSALQHAHDNGIIHRDIKSQNILVNANGHIKVSDFGIARIAGSHTISKTDNVMGSVHYFSPEQAKGEEVAFGSDLYSVGIVLFEMLTGQLPFDGETPVAVAMQHISAPPRSVMDLNPSVQPAFAHVVEKALAKHLDRRYSSAIEMAQDIRRALEEPDGTWLGRLPDKNQPLQPKNPETQSMNSTAKQKIVEKIKKHGFRWAWVLCVALIAVGIVVWGSTQFFQNVIDVTNAPDVLDKTEESAVRAIENEGLRCEVVGRQSNESIPAGVVLQQIPVCGTSMKKGETVSVIISTGPRVQEVPDIVGKEKEEAGDILAKYGFTMFDAEYRTSGEPYGTILEQTPKAGELMENEDKTIQVVLSRGPLQLPDFIGMKQEEALAQMNQLGMELEQVNSIPVTNEAQMNVGKVALQKFIVYDENNTPVEYAPGDVLDVSPRVILAVFMLSEMPDANAVENEVQQSIEENNQ